MYHNFVEFTHSCPTGFCQNAANHTAMIAVPAATTESDFAAELVVAICHHPISDSLPVPMP